MNYIGCSNLALENLKINFCKSANETCWHTSGIFFRKLNAFLATEPSEPQCSVTHECFYFVVWIVFMEIVMATLVIVSFSCPHNEFWPESTYLDLMYFLFITRYITTIVVLLYLFIHSNSRALNGCVDSVVE